MHCTVISSVSHFLTYSSAAGLRGLLTSFVLHPGAAGAEADEGLPGLLLLARPHPGGLVFVGESSCGSLAALILSLGPGGVAAPHPLGCASGRGPGGCSLGLCLVGGMLGIIRESLVEFLGKEAAEGAVAW